MADWKIQHRGVACLDCQKGFEEGEAYFSVLTIEEGSLGREDHCPGCFEGGGDARRERRGVEEVIWWRTRRQAEHKKGLSVDFDAIEALFLALEGRTDERLKELRYLLSLLLMRKRRLKLVRVRRRGEGEGEAMLLRRPRRQEELEVEVFDLTPERVDFLRGELERIVEGAGAEDILAGPAAARDAAPPGETPEASEAAPEEPDPEQDAPAPEAGQRR